MNSRSLAMLFRRPHRILKIFSTTMTTSQIHTPINKIKTTTANNITIFRNQNMYYSTLNPDTTYPKDLIHLSRFLLLPSSLTTLDSMAPVTRCKSFESVLLDLQSLGLFNNSSTFNFTLYHLCDKMDIFSLSQFLRLMMGVPYYPGNITFNKLLVSIICKLMNDDVIPQVYQLLGLKFKLGIELSANGWTSIIHKCCELGRLDDATKLFSDMIQTPYSLDVVPVTHTVLFKAFLDSNKVDDVLHLFDAMLSKGFEPDKDCFAKLVAALCADGRIDEAVNAYRAIVMKHPHSDVHLDNQIPIMIMTELINSGMNDKAATVFTLANGSLKVGEL